MKKKIILISSAVLLGAVLTTFILMRNKSLGNISVSVPAGEAKPQSRSLHLSAARETG